jgi:hypothetical protein
MAVTVKEITLWRREIDNRPGALAEAIEPLAGVDLQLLMGYRYTGNSSKGAIEVYPIGTKKALMAAQSAGLAESGIRALIVTGDNRPGLGHASAKAMSDAGINLAFLVAQVVGRKYSAIFGFDTDIDRKKASGLIKRAHSGGRKRS